MTNSTPADPVTPDGGETAITWEDARAANRDLWDDRAVLHEDLYDAHSLASDPHAISSVVRHDLSVLLQHLDRPPAPETASTTALETDRPLAGIDLLHLQCHIGTGTISWARLGARVTGLDFSAASLEVAGRLAAEAGVDITLVQSDVLAARAAVPGDFDVVYTSIGTIVWIDDLGTWARQIAALLRPGGIFHIRDGHPMLLALDERSDLPVLGFRYFPTGLAQTWDDGATYAGEGTTAHTRSYEWSHSMSEIIGSLLDAGLVLERFDEGRTLPWQQSPLMTPTPDGSGFEFPEPWRDMVPCSYTLVARRPVG